MRIYKLMIVYLDPTAPKNYCPKKNRLQDVLKQKSGIFRNLWINKHHVVSTVFVYKVIKLTTKQMNFKPPQMPADLYPCQWLVILNLGIMALEDLWVNQKQLYK